MIRSPLTIVDGMFLPSTSQALRPVPGAPCSSYRLQDLDKEDDDILAAFSTLDGNQNHKVYNTSPEKLRGFGILRMILNMMILKTTRYLKDDPKNVSFWRKYI